MNKRHDFAKLEREFVTSQVSLRELCRRHGISAHSLVTFQARKGKWAAKREAYRARESESFIEKHADRMADRQAEIRDKVLDAIDQAIDKFRADLKATKVVRQPAGEGPSSDTVPWPDPCEWRHSWFYRVDSDDTVTLLFEEGDPDPMAGE